MAIAALALRGDAAGRAPRAAAPDARPAHGSLLRDRTFVGLVLISGLMFATLFSYIGGSSFVLQEIYGLGVAEFGPGVRAQLAGLPHRLAG